MRRAHEGHARSGSHDRSRRHLLKGALALSGTGALVLGGAATVSKVGPVISGVLDAGKGVPGPPYEPSLIVRPPAELEFYDDFMRDDTRPGSLGSPVGRAGYEITGAGYGSSGVKSHRFVSKPGDVVYASQRLLGPIRRVGCRFGWLPADGRGSDSAICLLISTAAGAGLGDRVALHLPVSRKGILIQELTRSPPGAGPLKFVTIDRIQFPLELELHTPYTAECVVDEATIYYNIAGITGSVINPNIPNIGVGQWATWEHYYSSSRAKDMTYMEAVWADSAAGGVRNE